MVVQQEPEKVRRVAGKKDDKCRQVKMGLKTTPPQLIWAKEGEQGVTASPVLLQRRTDA